MSNSFKLRPTNFSRGARNFAGGASPPLRPPGYGPVWVSQEVENYQSLLVTYSVVKNWRLELAIRTKHPVVRTEFGQTFASCFPIDILSKSRMLLHVTGASKPK